jgi:hypothetical protein
MPNTVGVLDGSHIRLAACPQGDTDYINRKSFPSVQLQVMYGYYIYVCIKFEILSHCVIMSLFFRKA